MNGSRCVCSRLLWAAMIAVPLSMTGRPARAATYTWNGNPGGTWNTSGANWGGTGSDTCWDHASGSVNSAVFNTPGAAPSISETVYANRLTFDNTATVSDGMLSLAGATPTVTTNVDATISSGFIAPELIKAGSGKLTLGNVPGGDVAWTVDDGTLQADTKWSNGAVKGTVTVQAGATFIFTNNTENWDGIHVPTVSINGGTFKVTGSRITVWYGPRIVMTGGSFSFTHGGGGPYGTVSVTTHAAATTATIIDLNLRAYNSSMVATVEDGDAEKDLTVAMAMAGSGSLTKNGLGTMLLANSNVTYSGTTTVNAGTLELTDATGFNSGVTMNGGTLHLNGTAGAWTFGKAIAAGTGTGSLLKSGDGTVILSQTNTYTGTTTVTGGALDVTGSLANNGSDKVFIAAGADFSAMSPTLIRTVAAGPHAYAGLGSTVVGGTGASAGIVASAATNAEHHVGMSWRTALGADIALDGTRPISEVLRLTGMENTGRQTDPFLLQMRYNAPDGWTMGMEEDYARSQALYLGWHDGSQWENAVLGNSLVAPRFVGDMAWTATGIDAANLGSYVGWWGVDTSAHTAWAVLDHNSDFGVILVPEPAAITMLVIGAAGLAVAGWRRNKRP